ncbi:MAG: peptidylprolyl isomerase, partial [Ottowia sp.]|nr:peptidylprolyl isomerase [Ottowia sp.]
MQLMFKRVQRFRSAWLTAAFLVVSGGAMAQPSLPSAVVVNGPVGPLTAGELDFVVRERVPADKRAEFWSSPEQVTRLATGVYAQRVMAADAAKEKLDQSPQGQTYLRLSRDRAMAELLMQERVKAAAPSEEAQKAFAQSEYKAKPERFTTPEEVHVRHILLPVAKDGSDAAAVKTKAEALLAELRKGANFEELAKTRSGDPGSASKGGDLGVFTRGRMVPEFEKAAFA